MFFIHRLIGRIFKLKGLTRKELGNLSLSMDNFITFQAMISSGSGKVSQENLSERLISLVHVATQKSLSRIMRTDIKELVEIYGDVIKENNLMLISKKKMDEITLDLQEAMKPSSASSTGSATNTASPEEKPAS